MEGLTVEKLRTALKKVIWNKNYASFIYTPPLFQYYISQCNTDC